jgi:hypothetical protein
MDALHSMTDPAWAGSISFMMTDDFLAGVAEQVLGGRVPAREDPVDSDADDGIV